MGVRLEDFPDHIQDRIRARMGVEKEYVPVYQWHLEVTLGSGDKAKVMKSKPDTDHLHMLRLYNTYIAKHGSRNIKLVQTEQGKE